MSLMISTQLYFNFNFPKKKILNISAIIGREGSERSIGKKQFQDYCIEFRIRLCNFSFQFCQ